MAFKYVILAACLAVAQAGYLANPAAHAVGASQQSVVRSLDGNQVVSSYAKQVDTPFSSVRKYDTRVSNDAVAVAHAPVAYGAYAAPAVSYGAYAAPAVSYGAYAAPAAYAAPIAHSAYAAPALAHAAYAPAVARVGGLGVAYSAAPAVAHYSFDGLGAHYAF